MERGRRQSGPSTAFPPVSRCLADMGQRLRDVRLSVGSAGHNRFRWVFAAESGRQPRATAQFWYKLFPKKFSKRGGFSQSDDAFDCEACQPDRTRAEPLAPGPEHAGRAFLTRSTAKYAPPRRIINSLPNLRHGRRRRRSYWKRTPSCIGARKNRCSRMFRNYIYHGKKVDQQVHPRVSISPTR